MSERHYILTFLIRNGLCMNNKSTYLEFQPYYCEENIWHLCQHSLYLRGEVIFIASFGDSFPMLCQQGGEHPSQPIFWDYHVVLLRDGCIHDFNTRLPFSTPIMEYFEQSFIDESLLAPLQIPMFRVLSAEDYVELFLSDRRHMRTADGWNAPPPDWPLISETTSNLRRFIDMRDLEFGKVLSADELLNQPQYHPDKSNQSPDAQ